MKKQILLFVLAFVLVLSLALVACNTSEFAVTIKQTANGNLTADKTTARQGEDVVFTATADNGYQLDTLKINGEKVTVTENKYTLTNIQNNVEAEATFKGVQVQVTLGEEQRTVVFGSAYGQLPTPQIPAGQQFDGWFTENEGGVLVTAETLVSNAQAHTLYARFSTLKYTVTFNYGIGSGNETERKVEYGQAVGALPTASAQSAAFVGWKNGNDFVDENTVVTENTQLTATYITAQLTADNLALVSGLGEGNNISATLTLTVKLGDTVTTDYSVALISDNEAVVSVTNGVAVATGEGEATIQAKYNDVVLAEVKLSAKDYSTYTKVSNKDEFFAMANDKAGKYALVADIDLQGTALWDAAWKPLFGNFSGVIDGLGHTVSNTQIPNGWNNGAFSHMSGVVRNIAFVNVTTQETNHYDGGFFGFVSGTVENVYYQVNLKSQGTNDGGAGQFGMLVGTLEEGGLLKNCVVNINANANEYQYVAGLVANAASWKCQGIENCIVLTNGLKMGAPLANGLVWREGAAGVADYLVKNCAVVDSTIDAVNSQEFDISAMDPSMWKVVDNALYFGGKVALPATPEWQVYNDGNVTKVYGSTLPEDEEIGFTVLNYGKPTTEYTATITSGNTDVADVFEDAGVWVISYKGAGTTTITITVGEAVYSYDVTLIQEIHITTAEQFIAEISKNPAGTFFIDNDIDFAGQGMWIEKDGKNLPIATTFSGKLDGQGHVLKTFWLPGGWTSGMFGTVTGSVKNIAFTNVYSTGTNGAIQSGLFGALTNGAHISNVYLDFIITGNGGGPDNGYTGGCLAGSCDKDSLVENVVINLRTTDEVSAEDITNYGSICSKATSWTAVCKNVKVMLNGIDINLAYSDVVDMGIVNWWKNADNSCAQFENYIAMKAADLSRFDSNWEFGADYVKFYGNVVYTYVPDVWTIDEIDNKIVDTSKGTPEDIQLQIVVRKNGKVAEMPVEVVSSNTDVATVENVNGVWTIKYVADGSTDITITASDKATATFNVLYAEKWAITKINDKTYNTKDALPQDETLQLVVFNNGEETTQYTATVTSSDTSVATVENADGVWTLHFVGNGTTTITVAVEEVSMTFTVTLNDGWSIDSIEDKKVTIANGTYSENLSVVVRNQGAITTEYTANVTSSDSAVAAAELVEGVWQVKYLSAGNAEITVSVGDATATYTVVVSDAFFITNADEFRAIKDNLSGKYELLNDINLAGGWFGIDGVPLGNFSGTLDGNGYKISNGWLPGGWTKGLFGTVTGTIQNIAFINVYSVGTNGAYQTGLVGALTGGAHINNVYLDFIITGNGGTPADGYTGGCLAGSCDENSLVENVVINVRLNDGLTAADITNYGSICSKTTAWTAVCKNVKVMLNGINIELAYSDVTGTGIIDWWKDATHNCASYQTYAELLASDTTAFSSMWTFAQDGITFGQNKVYAA